MWELIIKLIGSVNLWSRLKACEEQRKTQEKELQELKLAQSINIEHITNLEQSVKALQELSYIGTVSVDNRGIIIDTGKNFSEMSGYSIVELIGRSLTDLIPIRFRHEHHEKFKEVIAGNKPLRNYPLEVEMRQKNGRELQVLVTLSEAINGETKIIKADVKRR